MSPISSNEETATPGFQVDIEHPPGALKPPSDNRLIDDRRFIREIERLRHLRTFLIQEGIKIKPEHAEIFSLGSLNQLVYSPTGRAPTLPEWKEVDDRFTKMADYLTTDNLRRRFVLGGTPRLMAWLPILLLSMSAAALIIGISSDGIASPAFSEFLRFVCYLVWLIGLGAIGAIAFISVNALSIQSDVTFDITNRRLLAVRIVLGALFGVVLSIPFGFSSFVDFCTSILKPGQAASQQLALSPQDAKSITVGAILLLLPFILGFSTSLVILVLNRLVESVAVIFGERRKAEPSAQ